MIHPLFYLNTHVHTHKHTHTQGKRRKWWHHNICLWTSNSAFDRGQMHSGAINKKTHREQRESDSAADRLSGVMSHVDQPIKKRWFINTSNLSTHTYLYKIKARQQRHAVFGWFLLGFVFGGRHLGVGPVAACWDNRLRGDVREELQSTFMNFHHQYFWKHQKDVQTPAKPDEWNIAFEKKKKVFKCWLRLKSFISLTFKCISLKNETLCLWKDN